jgi:hypothetical protein
VGMKCGRRHPTSLGQARQRARLRGKQGVARRSTMARRPANSSRVRGSQVPARQRCARSFRSFQSSDRGRFREHSKIAARDHSTWTALGNNRGDLRLQLGRNWHPSGKALKSCRLTQGARLGQCHVRAPRQSHTPVAERHDAAPMQTVQGAKSSSTIASIARPCRNRRRDRHTGKFHRSGALNPRAGECRRQS